MSQQPPVERQHRSLLRTIARRAMLERGLCPDFPAEALPELDGIHGAKPTTLLIAIHFCPGASRQSISGCSE
jgi:hypothetical protein